MTKSCLGKIKLSSITKKSALLLLLVTLFSLSSLGFAQSCKITKFVKGNEANNNSQFVIACITDYRVTTRFGRIHQSPSRDNPYDIELYSRDINNELKRVAVFNFWNPEQLHEVKYNPSEDHYDIHAPAQSYLSIIDLLRNEGDIELVVEQHAGDLWSGWLRTNLEPIGESE